MKNSEQPIYPITVYSQGGNQFGSIDLDIRSQSIGGLTKREYFAAMAMQGLLVNFQSDERYGNSPAYPQVARTAVEQADALLLELEKPTT